LHDIETLHDIEVEAAAEAAAQAAALQEPGGST
jgi:hypothetical protein